MPTACAPWRPSAWLTVLRAGLLGAIVHRRSAIPALALRSSRPTSSGTALHCARGRRRLSARADRNSWVGRDSCTELCLLARGAGAVRVHHDCGHGNTPACAGSRTTKTARSPWTREQPRVRGERWRTRSVISMAWGTAPRARGAASAHAPSNCSAGNSPACAGSSTRTPSGGSSPGEQPHVRGEQRRAAPGTGGAPGTAPRARGAGRVGRVVVGRHGNSPTCAGSRMSYMRMSSQPGEQPHVRGEQRA